MIVGFLLFSTIAPSYKSPLNLEMHRVSQVFVVLCFVFNLYTIFLQVNSCLLLPFYFKFSVSLLLHFDYWKKPRAGFVFISNSIYLKLLIGGLSTFSLTMTNHVLGLFLPSCFILA